MDKSEERLDRIEQHLAQLIGMVAKMSKETDERFSNLENRFDSFRKEVEERFDKVDASFEHLAQKWIQTDREVYYLKRQSK